MSARKNRSKGFKAPSLQELAPYFPGYKIEGFIAKGGMGAVYHARQLSPDRNVAIKILPREFGADTKFRASFEAEAQAMARLDHPNLVSFYESGDVHGMLYIIMELVEGKALYYSAHKKAIKPEVAVSIVAAISRALGHAHRGGIIHRDIKPANILLDAKLQPKVADFGLSSEMNRAFSEGLNYGTTGYSAPEIFSQDHTVDQRSDIFSVGVLLHELLTGIQPESSSIDLSSGVNPTLDKAIRKATQLHPDHRHFSVDDFANEIERAIARPKLRKLATGDVGSGIIATRVKATASIRLPSPQAASLIPKADKKRSDSPSPPLNRLPKKRKWPSILALIIGLLMFIGIIYIFAVKEPGEAISIPFLPHLEELLEKQVTPPSEEKPDPADSPSP